jgi:chromate transporter
VGAIAGAAYILARRSLIDVPTVLIGIVTLAVLMSTKKVPEPIVILVAGVIGIFLHGTVG